MDPDQLIRRAQQAARTKSIDEIKEIVRPLMKGLVLSSPVFPAGTSLYRARLLTQGFSKNAEIRVGELREPPPHLAQLGRANREESPVFYASISKEPVFFELGPLEVGSELIVTIWKTDAEMFLTSLGFTPTVFNRLRAGRNCPNWANDAYDLSSFAPMKSDVPPFQPDQNRSVRAAIGRAFMARVPATARHRYKVTVALAELHQGELDGHPDGISGVLYPTAKMFGNSDNVALTRNFAQSHLMFQKAIHVRVDGSKRGQYSTQKLDAATELDSEGRLVWRGADTNWTIGPGQRVKCQVVAGPDEFGDYESSPDGPLHWEVVDSEGAKVPLS